MIGLRRIIGTMCVTALAAAGAVAAAGGTTAAAEQVTTSPTTITVSVLPRTPVYAGWYGVGVTVTAVVSPPAPGVFTFSNGSYPFDNTGTRGGVPANATGAAQDRTTVGGGSYYFYVSFTSSDPAFANAFLWVPFEALHGPATLWTEPESPLTSPARVALRADYTPWPDPYDAWRVEFYDGATLLGIRTPGFSKGYVELAATLGPGTHQLVAKLRRN